tara:strand:+ start:672 stop:1484 length:813 start_codon:yes stop_codon:yes gene_type:complete
MLLELLKVLSVIILFIPINSCKSLIEDYDRETTAPSEIDQLLCSILNEMESIAVTSYKGDSLSTLELFDSIIADTNSFVSLSNINNWSISDDSTSYFIIYFPQEADSYYVALDQSSEFEIYNLEGQSKFPDNVNISLANIAGCSNMRMRYVYSNLNGAYLAKIINYSSSSVKLAILNNNLPPSANFIVNATTATVGDTLSFASTSQDGDYVITMYNWNFGDNNSSNDSSVVYHSYADSGTYTPSLTVSDGYLYDTIYKNGSVVIGSGDTE